MHGDAGDDIVYAGTGDEERYYGGADGTSFGDTLNLSLLKFGASLNLAAGGTFTTNGVGQGFAYEFERIVGSAFEDFLTGNNLIATNIDGGSGNDTIKGGTAADTLKGGTGNDKFVFVDAGQGFDHIADFAAGDKLQISKSGFLGGLENLAAGNLTDASYFVSAANATATGVGHGQFLFNTATRDLLWDADGVAGGAVQIAHFDNIYAIKQTDFLIAV